MRAQKPFVKLDEDVFQDPKIRALIKTGGFKAFGHYIGILCVIRKYKQTNYEIPYDDIQDIAEWDLHCPVEELKETINLCVDIGLFEDSDVLFWSNRRCRDLIEQDSKLLARQENAAAMNEKRRAKRMKEGG